MRMLFLLFGLLFFVACTQTTTDNIIDTSDAIIGTQAGYIAPDFTLTTVEGNSVSLSDYSGKKVIIAFFATWCVPCQIEADNIKVLQDENLDIAVFQIGVDNRESLEDLQKFKSERGRDDWIVGFGFDVAKNYDVKSLDTTIIIDEEGIIIYRDNGIPATVETLRRYLI